MYTNYVVSVLSWKLLPAPTTCTAFRKLMCVWTQLFRRKPSASLEETFQFPKEAFQFAEEAFRFAVETHHKHISERHTVFVSNTLGMQLFWPCMEIMRAPACIQCAPHVSTQKQQKNGWRGRGKLVLYTAFLLRWHTACVWKPMNCCCHSNRGSLSDTSLCNVVYTYHICSDTRI